MGLVALALLPPRWLMPWTSDLAAVAWFPLRPVERLLSGVRTWIRPPPQTDPELDERARQIAEERDRYRGLWYSERLRADELSQRLELVEGVKRSDRSESRPVTAEVLARRGAAKVQLLVIDAGSSEGVRAGDPVVSGGDLLVGRVVGEPESHRAQVAPLTHPSLGRLDALVTPTGGGAPGDAAFVPIQLRLESGRLVGEITQGSGVAAGDEVRLSDPAWPVAARGLRIGAVASLAPLESNPLRLQVEVKAETDPTRVGRVVVKCGATP